MAKKKAELPYPTLANLTLSFSTLPFVTFQPSIYFWFLRTSLHEYASGLCPHECFKSIKANSKCWMNQSRRIASKPWNAILYGLYKGHRRGGLMTKAEKEYSSKNILHCDWKEKENKWNRKSEGNGGENSSEGMTLIGGNDPRVTMGIHIIRRISND